MAETEQQMVARLLAPLAQGLEGAFGLRDDAAALSPPAGSEFIMTMDTLTAGLHFLFDGSPQSAAMAAHKALAVNVSDLASKGAEPYAYFMSLALPAGFEEWLDAFAAGLGKAQKQWGITLAGGDTVRSMDGLSITITALGVVEAGRMIRRSGAKEGDLLFVSGSIGDAVAGLMFARADEGTERWKDILTSQDLEFLTERCCTPSPRIGLIPALREFAHASLDISDGLALDASRMAEASGLAVVIEAALVPLSPAVTQLLEREQIALPDLLAGGDDYEVLAAVSPKDAEAFTQKAGESQLAVTRIGELNAGYGLTVLDAAHRPIQMTKLGWDHLG